MTKNETLKIKKVNSMKEDDGWLADENGNYKRHLFAWKGRSMPEWIMEMHKLFENDEDII